MPQMVPASTPTLPGLETPTPTSSKTGWSTISAITIDPTTPVPQTTTRFLSMTVLSIERSADPVLGEAVVLERVGVRGLRLALLGLPVDRLDRGLHLRRPLQPELVVDPARDAQRVGDQILEGDVDELVLVVPRPGVMEGVERAGPQVQLGVADHAADVGVAVADRGLRGERARRRDAGDRVAVGVDD